MRKNIHCKMIVAVLLAAMTLSGLTGCKKAQTANMDNSTEKTQNKEDSTKENTTIKSDNSDNETTQAQQSDNETVDNGQDVVGVSSTGYTIQNINGITYVDGIMIVNKTYSLPESFNPGGLNQDVLDAFTKMQADASAAGLNIWIQSSFRTYEYQDYLYNSYVATDGKAAADTYSARPGFSEHQSGLCFDLNSIDDTFTDTPEGKWVDAHAHEYGFIIRFPKGKEALTGYKYESWHLRYVGVDIATKMYQNNLCLEEYLGVTSQYDN